MSNAIAILETIGRDASLAHAQDDLLKLAVLAQIEPSLREAILGRDQARVEAVLGVHGQVFCGFFPGKKEDEEEEPAKDDDEVSLQYSVCSIA